MTLYVVEAAPSLFHHTERKQRVRRRALARLAVAAFFRFMRG